MKILKKIIAIIFSGILLSFSGCGTAPRTISGNIAIAENGIVEEEIFRQLKEDNSIAVFSGESNGIKYEWTIFGNYISEQKDLNLAVDFYETDYEKAVAFEFSSKEDLGFRPMLSIYLNENWQSQSASVYSETDGNLIPVCSASITGSKSSILNFPVSETHGKYVIIADKDNITTDIIYTKTDKSTTTTSTEKKNHITTTVMEESSVIVAETVQNDSTDSDNTNTTEETSVIVAETVQNDDTYLDNTENNDTEQQDSGRIYSDGSATEQDKYLTDPIPEGKPMPVEPENAEIDDSKIMSCTFSIECSTILNNISELETEKLDVLPSDGIIFETQTVEFKDGESVFDVLQRICSENNIHMEASWTPIYNSAYVEGINNLYEFDCGNLSGWMYRVNGWYPNYGCSRYQLAEGDIVEWRFTCDLGKDVGCDWLSGT